MVFKRYSAADDTGKTAAVTISVFPGATGGLLANVNRWRGQLSLAARRAEDDLAEVTQTLDIMGSKAMLVDFTGTDKNTGQPGRLIAVIVPHGQSTWFYKLMGDGAAVEGQKEAFMKFIKTAQYL